jgi:phage regulator Rha-like protein
MCYIIKNKNQDYIAEIVSNNYDHILIDINDYKIVEDILIKLSESKLMDKTYSLSKNTYLTKKEITLLKTLGLSESL